MNMSPDFLRGLLLGLLLGFLVAGLLGRAAQKARRGKQPSPLARIRAFGKPQQMSVASKQTPYEMLIGCAGGFGQIAIWVVVIALAIVWLLRYLR